MKRERVTLITLGVQDLDRSRRFYADWGWQAHPASQPGLVLFQMTGAALALFALLCLLPLLGSLHRLGSALPLALYAVASLLTFFLYWRDKHSALKDHWRTPETTLHFFELAGGWPGALVAQQVFRHKTRKLSYQLTFWLIVVLHQAFWIDLLFIGSGFTRERLDWLLRLL